MTDRKLLIGLTGRAGAGKDVVCGMIKDQLPNITTYRMAGPLKEACMQLFDWTQEQVEDREFKEAIDPRWGFSPRKAMQLMGTEYGRELLRDDLWVHMAQLKYESPSVSGMIVSDVRFENEADFIRRNGGLLIHITRPGEAIQGSAHASEAGVSFVEGDDTIDNSGTLDDLRTQVKRVLERVTWAHKYSHDD